MHTYDVIINWQSIAYVEMQFYFHYVMYLPNDKGKFTQKSKFCHLHCHFQTVQKSESEWGAKQQWTPLISIVKKKKMF